MIPTRPDRPLRVLHIEDNPDDELFMRRAIERTEANVELHSVRSGEEALDVLRRVGGSGASPMPHMLLLDLNLPGLDGHEVLAKLKADPALRLLPVVIVSSSDADADVCRAYHTHANAYIVKPSRCDDFDRLVRAIESFWHRIVRLPDLA